MEYFSRSTTTSPYYINSNMDNSDMSKTNHKTLNDFKISSERECFQISNKPITKDEWDSISKILETSKNFNTLSTIAINIDSYGLKKLIEMTRLVS